MVSILKSRCLTDNGDATGLTFLVQLKATDDRQRRFQSA